MPAPARQPRVRRHRVQHRAEIPVSIGRFHVPQRFAEPVRTCSRWLTSERIVLSDKPAAERASTNPANTSVSNRSISSGPTGSRISRRSRTAARATAPPRLQSIRTNIDLIDIGSKTMKLSQNPVRSPERVQTPWSRYDDNAGTLSEPRGYFLGKGPAQSWHLAARPTHPPRCISTSASAPATNDAATSTARSSNSAVHSSATANSQDHSETSSKPKRLLRN